MQNFNSTESDYKKIKKIFEKLQNLEEFKQ